MPARGAAPEVTVVVPARNAQATIGATLRALAAQDVEAEFEIVVVDSGSTDATRAIVMAAGGVSLLSNPGGEPAGSRNLGARAGRGRVLAFTDADCEPATGWLAAGLHALRRADIVQGAVLPERPPDPFERTVSVTSEYGIYETANLLVRREVFDRVGGFAAVLDLGAGGGARAPFGEDTWFVWRARRLGASTTFEPEAIVRHAVFPRSPLAFAAERARAVHFPRLVALIPELRSAFLYRRWFLSAQSFRFDVALAGALVSLAGRRRLPVLAAGAVYAGPLARRASWAPRGERWRVGLWRVVGDAVTCGALLAGSWRARTLVL